MEQEIKNKPIASDFMQGGGEMGARMREFDWSATSLGPVELWPQSLRTCVRILLTSRQPMFVWWGEELINLYNDAYKAIVGGKHPVALGQPAAVVWREIWHQVWPRAESAMHKNEGTYDESLLLIMERYGYQEETYYTFSYSPVPNDQGGNGGIICANTDDTQRIIGERQLSLLRELAAGTADARTPDEACLLSAKCLQSNGKDLPFAMIYLVDLEKHVISLAGSCGIESGHKALPISANIDEPTGWPVAEVLKTNKPLLVTDLAEKFGPLPIGEWQRPPEQAAILPLSATGLTGKPGLLIVGLNPYRLFEDNYQGFLELVAGQITASIANAQAYEEERKRAESLAELDRAKTAFFSNVSHEFRTPLTLMLGPLEDAGSASDQLPARVNEQIAVAHRNALRLLRLVNTLLDFSRIEAGRVQASYQATDLARLTVDLASVFRSAVERAGLELIINCSPLPEPVYIDRDMWEKIVLNLISNAFKFTFNGEIVVQLQTVADHVELMVRDSGTGIPAAEIPHLFERFHRVEGARGRTHEGSGIGLALVQELVKLHGGLVIVESIYGQGSTFRVRIPYGYAHLPGDRIGGAQNLSSTAMGADPFVEEALRWLPTESTHDLSLQQLSSQSITQVSRTDDLNNKKSERRARLLLADDNADMRDYLTRLLSEKYQVTAVADGAIALELIRTQRPDLVLTDVMMPHLDGFGLLRELRTDPDLRDLPVVMLSARAGEESRVEGLESGADDYLIKPFSARELLARVSSHLELARVRREAQQQIINIWESIDDGLVVFDRDWRYIYVNPASEKMGYTRANLLGKILWEVFPKLRIEVEAPLRQALSEGVSYEFETYNERQQKWYENRAFPSADGNVSIYFRDITLRKQVETERAMLLAREQAAREQAEAANRLKDEFLATISHELRTPLNAILGWANLLRTGRVAPDQIEKALATVERNARAQNQIINDLLDVSRIVSGNLRLDIQPVSLISVIQAAIDTMRPAAEAKQLRLQLLLDPSAGPVMGDADRLQQIIWNLLSNSIKFTPKNGRIQVRLERVGSQVEITVTDTGKGINRDFLPFIFERFRQEDSTSSRKHGGLGLGLAIVRHLVELHGGSIYVDSSGEGQGATFSFLLPVSPVRRTLENEEQSHLLDSNLLPTTINNHSLTDVQILLVDDEPSSLELAMMILSKSGASVRATSSTDEALAMLDKWKPDVIVSDIGMPEVDGYAFIRQIRALPQCKHIPAAALTAYARMEDRIQALKAGYQSHISKPVEPSELITVVASLAKRFD